jgi:ABC-type nitrate/sulfonate/bicarbonate transport system permease component
MKTETLAQRNAPAAPLPGRPRRSFWRRHESLVLGGGAVLLVLAVWQAVWSAGMISPLFFTGPSAIASRFYTTLTNGSLLQNIGYSGRNFLIGFAMAVAAGVTLGVLIGWYRRLRLVLDPFINALYSTPRIALIPLIIIWFGVDIWSKIVIIFLSGVFPVLVNTVVGIRTLDNDLLRAARSFCASDWQIFRTIAVPGSVPFILAGVRQGVAHALIGVVVGEMLAGSPEGIGFMISFSGYNFNLDSLFLYVTVVAVAGILLTSLVERFQARFERWRPER